MPTASRADVYAIKHANRLQRMRLRLRAVHRAENLVRPFTDRQRKQLLDRLLAKRNAPGEEQEAELIWGQASDFNVIDPPRLPGFRVNNPDTPPEDLPPELQEIEYNEVDRETTMVRVENPNDSEQYVMVERIDTITFDSSSDNIRRKFILNWS